MMTTLPSNIQRSRLERSGVNRLIQIFVSILLMGVVMFLSAGRLDWPAAWVFLGTYVLVVLTLGVWVIRKSPAVVNERGKIARDAKSWDKVLMTIYSVMLLAVFAVAGLDVGRFGSSAMPIALQVVGFAALIFSMTVTYWAMANNPFLSTVVRIQDDRGHYVATSGPYRYVRHPMYAALLLMWPGVALELGSWWALIPAAVIVVVFVIRTALEDRTLQADLPGYIEYARQVRYRLVPGIW